MRLPPHEKLRSRREREFQRHLLATVEKPKQNRLLKIINSAAFLWLLSALFITAGGSYFTKYQECARDADQITEKFQHIEDELHVRRRAIFQAIADGASMDVIRTSIKELPSIYADLKPRTIPDLEGENRKLNARIDHSKLGDLVARFRLNQPTVPPRQMQLYGGIARGDIPKAWPDSALQNLKDFAARYAVSFERGYLAVRYSEFSSTCYPDTVLRMLFSTSKPDLVQATPHPLFVNAQVPQLP